MFGLRRVWIKTLNLNMDEIKKLKSNTERLLELLNTPELDLESWYMAVSYACSEIGKKQYVFHQMRINRGLE